MCCFDVDFTVAKWKASERRLRLGARGASAFGDFARINDSTRSEGPPIQTARVISFLNGLKLA